MATQYMLNAAYKEGYAAYPGKGPCPYFNHGGRNPELEPLFEAWNRGYDCAHSDDLDAYMAGLSQQNAAEEDLDAIVLAAIDRQNAKEEDARSLGGEAMSDREDTYGGIFWVRDDDSWVSATPGESCAEIKRLRAENAKLKDELKRAQDKLSAQSWQMYPDRSGGQFTTHEELDGSSAWP